jgi:DNA (cytosine-5)-methyltransferase 1
MVSAESGWFFRQQLAGFKRHGYRVRFAELSASDFGVPQSRKRVFIVGIRRDVRGFKYRFPRPTHGPNGRYPLRVLRDAIGHLPEWPEGEYFQAPFHGHYLTRQRKRRWGELSYTVVANAHHVPLHPMGWTMAFVKKDTWCLRGDANRRLSWRECAALQDLPSHLEPSGRLEDKYRIVGNAVPPAFGQALLTAVVRFECGG